VNCNTTHYMCWNHFCSFSSSKSSSIKSLFRYFRTRNFNSCIIFTPKWRRTQGPTNSRYCNYVIGSC